MKKLRMILLPAAALFVFALLLFGFFSRPQKGASEEGPGFVVRAAAEAPAPAAPAPDYGGLLRISELMVKNRASLCVNGAFPDWVELENLSASPVALSGWALSDRELGIRYALNAGEIAPGGVALIPCSLWEDFALAPGETLYLFSPDGAVQDSVRCDLDEPDRSLARGEDGAFAPERWPSPGFANGPAGYESFCRTQERGRCLQIWEVMVSNTSIPFVEGGTCDWVELRNCSDEPLSLSGYLLSDKADQPDRWRFPDLTLEPGELFVVRCDEAAAPSERNTGFALNAVSEQLYLRDAGGDLLDWLPLHDIPADASVGRSEERAGLLYFAEPTPGEANGAGMRRVSDAPAVLTADGIYDDVESLSAAFSSPGVIRFTADGTVPDESAALYEAPIPLEKTTVLRVRAWEEDALPSPVLSCSYILNEHHTLPVLSLATDDPATFRTMYLGGRKRLRTDASLSLYDADGLVFRHDCELRMQGWTSLKMEKKSMCASFPGRCGGDLRCDVFGSGIDLFHSLSIRAGQDYPFTIFRNELFQSLAQEASEAILTQDSRWCVLYVNGEYYGLYCLKEDLTKQYYASHMQVDKSSVLSYRTPVVPGTPFYDEILAYALHNDLTEDEHYRYLCERIDMDCLIDWLLIESYSANSDVQGNLRVFRSDEGDGKWRFALYDLDWAFYYKGCSFFMVLNGESNMPILLHRLIRNSAFRDRVFRRYAELTQTVLSDEHVLAKIDEFEALLAPEAPRDRLRWHQTMNGWQGHLAILRAFITDNSWASMSIDRLCAEAFVSAEERAVYFDR